MQSPVRHAVKSVNSSALAETDLRAMSSAARRLGASGIVLFSYDSLTSAQATPDYLETVARGAFACTYFALPHMIEAKWGHDALLRLVREHGAMLLVCPTQNRVESWSPVRCGRSRATPSHRGAPWAWGRPPAEAVTTQKFRVRTSRSAAHVHGSGDQSGVSTP